MNQGVKKMTSIKRNYAICNMQLQTLFDMKSDDVFFTNWFALLFCA